MCEIITESYQEVHILEINSCTERLLCFETEEGTGGGEFYGHNYAPKCLLRKFFIC